MNMLYDPRFNLEGRQFLELVCSALGVFPKQQLIYQWDEARELVWSCEWHHFYDVVQRVYEFFNESDPTHRKASEFQKLINTVLANEGIGWQLVSGEVVMRGDEAFESTIKAAAQELTDRPTTRARIQEAISDLSRRPKPDLSGAVSHAFAAMESIIGDIEYTPEEIRENTHHTFGTFLQRYADLFPSEDFREGFQRLWKYANNEGSRHGKEGIEPARDEAELIVSLAAALVTYLNRKHPK
jgi:hypothetical protein